VVVYGAQGVGLEVSKNLVLAGVKSVSIVDDAGVDASDLGSHFYAVSDRMGSRGTQSIAGIQDLNGLCRVKSVSAAGDASLEAIECGAYDCVVCCQGAAIAVAVSEACRRAAIRVPFVWVRCVGARFLVFDDFGDDFPVADRELHGAAAEPSLLEPLVEEATGLYLLRTAGDRERHEAADGDRLELDAAGGDGGLALVVNEVITPHALRATVVSGCVDPCLRYSARVIPALRIVKQRKLVEALRAERVVASVDGVGASRNLLTRLIAVENPALGCVAAVAGGVAAHDCLKALTGGILGGPVPGQFLYHNALMHTPLPEFILNKGCRYAAARNCFGDVGLKHLRESTVFVVGAGATGCEILKNIVLLGVSTVYVADDDAIELSNLSRQFLYRDADVGLNKATTAKRAIDGLRSDTKVIAVPRRVNVDSCRTTFDDSFWCGIDLVFTALDSVEARLYLDSICVAREIPLVDCGTLGSKGSVQPAVPHITESYGATSDPSTSSAEDNLIPICTLKHHPYKAEHVVQWAADQFQDLFSDRIARLHDVLLASTTPGGLRRWARCLLAGGRSNPKLVATYARSAADDVDGLLAEDSTPDAWAGALYRQLYQRNVDALISDRPLNATDEHGAPYWTGTRVFPRRSATLFDKVDVLDPAPEFVAYAATLRRTSLGQLPRTVDIAHAFLGFLGATSIGANVLGIDSSATLADASAALETSLARLQRRCEAANCAMTVIASRLNPLLFDKDSDTGHVEFVQAAANCRAKVFSIPYVDFLRCKQIAGRVIPAVATTTAVVAGLAALEATKILAGRVLSADIFSSSYVNLGTPLWSQAPPGRVDEWFLLDGTRVSEWTTKTLRLGLQDTLNSVTTKLQSELFPGAKIAMIVTADKNQNLIYLRALHASHEDARTKPFEEWLDRVDVDERIMKQDRQNSPQLRPRRLDVQVTADNENGSDVQLPPVCIILPER